MFQFGGVDVCCLVVVERLPMSFNAAAARSSPRRRRDRGSAVATTTTDESALPFSAVGNHADNNCHTAAGGGSAVTATAAAAAVTTHNDNASVWIRTMMPPATLINHSMDILDGGGTTQHANTAASSTTDGHFGYRGDPTLNEQGGGGAIVPDATVVTGATVTNEIGSQNARAAAARAEFSTHPSAIATSAMLLPETGNVVVRHGDSSLNEEDRDNANDTATNDVTTGIPEIVLQDSDVLSGTGKVSWSCKRRTLLYLKR
jgi:hypothetical protein